MDTTLIVQVIVAPLDTSKIVPRNDVWKIFSTIQEVLDISQFNGRDKLEEIAKGTDAPIGELHLGEYFLNLVWAVQKAHEHALQYRLLSQS